MPVKFNSSSVKPQNRKKKRKNPLPFSVKNLSIEVNNLTKTSVDKNFLKKVTVKVLQKEGKKNSFLSLALAGQEKIKRMNKEYRDKNKPTDVLSFPGSGFVLGESTTDSVKKVEDLGEIVICLQEVKKNAKRFGFSFKKELARVLIHGILHLLGYDHEKGKKEAEKMRKKEENYLLQLNL